MPYSEKMLSSISEPQSFWGHYDSLVGSRVAEIELVMEGLHILNYLANLVLIDNL